MTPEQVKEFVKCKKSVVYFIETYCKISHPDKGIVPFILYDFQKEILKKFQIHQYNIANKSRQVGLSTLTASYALWLALFHKNKSIIILSIKDEDAQEFLKKIKLAYEELPDWMTDEPLKNNAHNLKLSNGSSITSTSSNAQATRGRTPSLLIIDEVAFIDKIEDIWTAALPTLSRGGSAILISCVTGDTMVYTNKGIFEIEEFVDKRKSGGYKVEPFKVLGEGKLRYGNIFYNNGISKIHEIITKHSLIRCSPEHKFWCFQDGEYKWVKAKDLRKDSWLSIQYGANVWNELGYDTINSDTAYLLGVILSDYANSKITGNEVIFSFNGNLSKILNKLKLPFENISPTQYRINSKEFVKNLDQLGFNFSVGNCDKKIPTSLLKLSRFSTVCFLNGIFDNDADNNKKNKEVVLNLSSFKMVNQIRVILSNFGVLTNYNFDSKSKLHTLTVDKFYYKKFNKEIGFYLIRKQNKTSFDKLKNELDDREDVIPDGMKFLNKRRFGNIKRKVALDKIGVIPGIIDPHIKWVKVEGNNITKEEEVYDFSLPDIEGDDFCHSVIYNSFIGHQTPSGIGNFFHDMWEGCQKYTPKDRRNDFVPTFVHWTQIPEYRGFDNTKGMTFEEILERAKMGSWYKKMRPNISDKKWNQEFEGDFLGSGNTVVTQRSLKKAKKTIKDPIKQYEFELDNKNNILAKEVKDDGDLWIWEQPNPNSYYIIAADVSSGDGSDYSAFQVLDVFSGTQVAEYRGLVNTTMYSKILYYMGKYYCDAYLVPEVTGMGYGVVHNLVHDLYYPNIYQTADEQTGQKKKFRYGWQTGIKTRPLIIQSVQDYVESGDFEFYSIRLWKELGAFVWKNGKAQADGRNNDDLVMSLGIAYYNKEMALKALPHGIIKSSRPNGNELKGIDNVNQNTGEIIDPYSLEPISLDSFKTDRYVDGDDTDWLLS